jgi:hypothetical protein
MVIIEKIRRQSFDGKTEFFHQGFMDGISGIGSVLLHLNENG